MRRSRRNDTRPTGRARVQPLVLVVNGDRRTVATEPTTRLLSVVRDQLRLHGTKAACSRGECGSCTVLVGDRTVNACITLARTVDEPVTTIEGLEDETLQLRGAFADAGAFQCGYCTPGQIVRAAWLLRHRNEWDADDLPHLLAGNICRCTGYSGILEAIAHVARKDELGAEG